MSAEEVKIEGVKTDDAAPSTEAAEDVEEKLFECVLCGLSEKYDYFGMWPPFSHPISFTEDVFVMKDPFSAESNKVATNYLLLGAVCSECSASVCVDQTSCSIYYGKRFCRDCALRCAKRFPPEIQKDLSRFLHYQSSSKAPS